jgi:hypothetical protein
MFRDMTNINLKEMMYKETISQIEADMMPFGVIDNGITESFETDQHFTDTHGNEWAIDTTDRFF